MPEFHIVTLFPEFFSSPFATSLMGKSRDNGLTSFTFHNPRDFSENKHRHVDDRPFGGGPGMVMQAPPIYRALKSIPNPGRILLLSPSGKPLTPELCAELAKERHLTLICGRYEGIDARISALLPMEEINVCPVVLNGGETAALVLAESVSRLEPGFMGCAESALEESFSSGLLEYPHYTRPEEFLGQAVPEILRGGNHAAIAAWRRQMSLQKTLAVRPELLADAPLTKNDAQTLAETSRLRTGRNLSFCLMHHPVVLEKRKVGVSSLTNLDIHDIARISLSYGMGNFYVYTPLRDQLELLRQILEHWTTGSGSHHADRCAALKLVRPVPELGELEKLALQHYGVKPLFVATSAAWPDRTQCLSCAQLRSLCQERPVIICLGTARGLDLKSLPFAYQMLRPLRFLNANHLSVRSAAAILADRIIGDFC